MEKELRKDVIGQIAPIQSVSAAIRRKLNGWYDPEHSNLVFLFLGSSGVGKTMLAKSLSKILGETQHTEFIRYSLDGNAHTLCHALTESLFRD